MFLNRASADASGNVGSASAKKLALIRTEPRLRRRERERRERERKEREERERYERQGCHRMRASRSNVQ